jgi:hypothetical protein
MGYRRNIHGMYKEHSWDIEGILMGYRRNIHGI